VGAEFEYWKKLPLLAKRQVLVAIRIDQNAGVTITNSPFVNICSSRSPELGHGQRLVLFMLSILLVHLV
jgi:hypothetical protein